MPTGRSFPATPRRTNGRRGGEIAGAAIQRQHAERRDDGRQRQRHREELKHQRAAEKAGMRDSARATATPGDRQQRGQGRLPQGEARHPEQIAVEGGGRAGKVAGALGDQAAKARRSGRR